MKKILITGANSYIGTSFDKWLTQWPDDYSVDTMDMIDGSWREKSFAGYDVVFHVAGIAHVSADSSEKELYYKINRDLAIETAEKAKAEGVRQFIFMSSMIIYGADEPVGKEKVITRDTEPSPVDFYGDSKLQADIAIQNMADDSFIVAIMRPPVIYGPGCKGNFPRLVKLARYALVFPELKNSRSMLYIDNLNYILQKTIDEEKTGIFFPHNACDLSTAEIIKTLRDIKGKKTYLIKLPKFVMRFFSHFALFNKMFGTKRYDISESAVSFVSFREGLKKVIGTTGDTQYEG